MSQARPLRPLGGWDLISRGRFEARHHGHVWTVDLDYLDFGEKLHLYRDGVEVEVQKSPAKFELGESATIEASMGLLGMRQVDLVVDGEATMLTPVDGTAEAWRLRLARERTELRVVNDQVGAPTWSRWIASMTADIVGHELSRGEELGVGLAGLYHLTAAGSTTWYEFARCILDGDPHREEQICRAITPISSEEFGALAERPRYSILDCTAFVDRFRVSLVNWRDQLGLVLAELRQAERG